MITRSTADQILDVDAQLLLSVDRLKRYEASKSETSIMVQRRVIDRQLDARLELMLDRDRAAVAK